MHLLLATHSRWGPATGQDPSRGIVVGSQCSQSGSRGCHPGSPLESTVFKPLILLLGKQTRKEEIRGANTPWREPWNFWLCGSHAQGTEAGMPTLQKGPLTRCPRGLCPSPWPFPTLPFTRRLESSETRCQPRARLGPPHSSLPQRSRWYMDKGRHIPQVLWCLKFTFRFFSVEFIMPFLKCIPLQHKSLIP